VAGQPFDAATWITSLLAYLEAEFTAQAATIAHIKLSLKTPTASLKASLTQLGQPISWDLAAAEAKTDRAQFILNARVNIDARTLEQVIRQALEETGPQPEFRCDFTHFECFSPRPPKPTHRLEGVESRE
jgi:hypothetical protein